MSAALSSLTQGTTGQIVGVTCQGELKQRLASLGFMQGAKVTVGHSTIMNGPRTYTIRGSQVSLRGKEAASIMVE
ncbi:MAG: ferrous iron transport protein A [Gammaproteobacteria bacterium]|nr:ferrous iron transport protein A [Gammaproteobacteria bacterium]